MSCIFLRTSWRTRGIIAARSCCWPDRRVTGCPARSQQACGSGHSGRKKQNKSMILTTPELIATLQHEVRILLHLARKVEPPMLDYRPTPKQRSALELRSEERRVGKGWS